MTLFIFVLFILGLLVMLISKNVDIKVMRGSRAVKLDDMHMYIVACMGLFVLLVYALCFHPHHDIDALDWRAIITFSLAWALGYWRLVSGRYVFFAIILSLVWASVR